jgi:hypothetical protein
MVVMPLMIGFSKDFLSKCLFAALLAAARRARLKQKVFSKVEKN